MKNFWVAGLALLFGLSACAPMFRPKREAADAIMAAKDTLEQANGKKASRLAPQDYREARETLLEAQDQYKNRRYDDAKEMADLARHFAESALAKSITAAKVAPKKKPAPKKKIKPLPKKS